MLAAALAMSSGMVGCGSGTRDGVEFTAVLMDDTGLPPTPYFPSVSATAVPVAWLTAHAAETGQEFNGDGREPWVSELVNELGEVELAALGGDRAEMAEGRLTLQVAEGPFVVCLDGRDMEGPRLNRCDGARLPAQGEMTMSFLPGSFSIST